MVEAKINLFQGEIVMKSLIVVISLIVVFSSNVFANNNSGILYYVNGFYQNSESVKKNITQEITGYNEACGPTSLLFIKNHDFKQNYGSCPVFTGSKALAQQELLKMYSFIGLSSNSETTLDNLKYIAKSYWGWKNVIRMSSTTSIYDNTEKLISYLNNNKLALVVLKDSFSGNPVLGFDHIVIIYTYQRLKDSRGYSPTNINNDHLNDKIYFYDPYYGGSGYFKRGEISTAVNLTNFAYLIVAP